MKDQFGNEINSDSAVNSNVERDTVYQDKEEVLTDSDSAVKSNVERDTVYEGREEVLTDSDSLVNRNAERDTAYEGREEVLTDSEKSDQDKALIGIFNTENEAINVIKQLKEIGYRDDDITVIAKDKEKMDRIDDITDVNTETQDDAGRVGFGAGVGGALGGITAAVPALGLIAIPGIGPILAAGPIAVILGGALAGGVFGGLVGALSQMGVREEDAKEYENQIEQGKIIVLVENKYNVHDEVYNIYKQNNNVVDSRPQQL